MLLQIYALSMAPQTRYINLSPALSSFTPLALQFNTHCPRPVAKVDVREPITLNPYFLLVETLDDMK